MGGDTPSTPAAQPAPAAPDYAAANREGIEADIETLPTRKRVEAAARLGRSVYDPETGKTYDFTGLGDSELALEQARVNSQTADMQAQSILDIQKKYGSEFTSEALKRLEEADPTGMEARRELAQTVLDDAQLGASLSAEDEGRLEQQYRGGQAARGNILGNAATAEEVLGKTEFGQKLKQQRLSNIAGYVMGTPLTAQYQNLSAAQNQTAPYQPVAYQPGVGLNSNAGTQGAAFASSIYGQQSANTNAANQYQLGAWNTQMNQANPWMQGLGMLGGIGSTLGAGALACWVAEVLWGVASPKVARVREFVQRHMRDDSVLGDFCRNYQAYGRQWANVVRDNHAVRLMASVIWEMLHSMAMREDGEAKGESLEDGALTLWMQEIEPLEA